MSKFLPIENLTYKSRLSKEDVLKNLSDNIENEKSFRFGVYNQAYSKPYIGKIVGNTFEIKRAITYRNSFLPIIRGEVSADYVGTKILVKMKPHTFVIFFMSIWLGGISIGCLATLYALFSQKFDPSLLIPFGMLFFGIALFYGAFKSESKTSIEDLKRILEAEIV
jgi:hypothetical protein